MSDERAWDYCSICGRKIQVGEMCYGVKRNAALLFSGNTICKDCIAPENYEPAPADDVRPEVRGRWIECDYVRIDSHGNIVKDRKAAWCCSECRRAFKKELLWRGSFCPNCGADMRGGSEQ